MIDPVSSHVEAGIYLYFVLIAGIGCYVHARLWLVSHRTAEGSESANPN